MWVGVVSNPQALAAIQSGVLAPAFPASERGTAEELVAGVRAGRQWVLGAREDDAWVGAAVVRTFSHGELLLEWLAVAPSQRGRGTGRLLLDRVGGEARDVGASHALAEIEPPGTVPEAAVHGDPVRRARFYQGAGARMLAITHYQPPAGPGLPLVPLLLIAVPVPGIPLLDSLPAADVRAFLTAYHAEAPDHPLVRASVESVTDPEVWLVDLADVFG